MSELADIDVVYGAKEISKLLKMTPRAVYRLVERDELPVFYLGGRLAARRTRLMSHFASLEAAADAERAARRAGEGGA